MHSSRIALVFSSLLLIAAWSAPIDAAEEQRRARRRGSGTTQTQRAPQRSAPARRAPTAGRQRGDRNGESARRAVPRRAPRPSTDSGRGRDATRVMPPSTGGTPTMRRTDRSGGRPGRAGTGRQGTAQVDRRPPRGRVVGTAVRRQPLPSRPIVVSNDGRRGGRLGYTPYRGRYRFGGPRIYGTAFYFPSYNIGFGVGYGSSYGYNPYSYGRYGQIYGYGYSPVAYGGYADSYYTGSLRLKVKPRFGEVFVDGYYVGLVNDYDGVFQRLRLEEGPHHVEIHEPGFELLEFDVLILPGETITYEGYLRPLP